MDLNVVYFVSLEFFMNNLEVVLSAQKILA